MQSTVLGGNGNMASGTQSIVLGGSKNIADGTYSVVAGHLSDAAGYSGVFIWSDSTSTATLATSDNQFIVQAEGGIILNGNVQTNGNLILSNANTTTLSQTSTVDRVINLPDSDGTLMLKTLTTKGDLLGHNGSIDVRVPVGANDYVLTADSTQSSGWKWASPSVNLISLSFGMSSFTDNTSYTTLSVFIFPGSTSFDISAAKVVSRMDSGPTSYDIRIQDITNALTVATANFTNLLDEINDMGTLSNLPVAESIFEIQIKRNGGSGGNQIYLRSAQLS